MSLRILTVLMANKSEEWEKMKNAFRLNRLGKGREGRYGNYS